VTGGIDALNIKNIFLTIRLFYRYTLAHSGYDQGKRPQEIEIMDKNRIYIIDETLREGMQNRGIVFSLEQAETILQFQEALGVDICQAGYPPAHVSEQEKLKNLVSFAFEKGFTTRVAAMGRASAMDAEIMAATKTMDFHFHAHVPESDRAKDMESLFTNVSDAVTMVRKSSPKATISLAILDMGRSDPVFLSKAVKYLIHELAMDIISLPDTSGIMGPNEVYATILPIALIAKESSTRLSIHCHNDLGMASANTIMGVAAGATIVEASAFGIGERNGLADLYTTGTVLRNQGYPINLNLDDIKTFTAYYNYMDSIYREQTGEPLLTYNTPFFGVGVKTHVAGTHSSSGFGLGHKEQFFLNILCGKKLVKSYLDQEKIKFDPTYLNAITEEVKSRSANLGRRVFRKEIEAIAGSFTMKNSIDTKNLAK